MVNKSRFLCRKRAKNTKNAVIFSHLVMVYFPLQKIISSISFLLFGLKVNVFCHFFEPFDYFHGIFPCKDFFMQTKEPMPVLCKYFSHQCLNYNRIRVLVFTINGICSKMCLARAHCFLQSLQLLHFANRRRFIFPLIISKSI